MVVLLVVQSAHAPRLGSRCMRAVRHPARRSLVWPYHGLFPGLRP
jgi:hypothetical protein